MTTGLMLVVAAAALLAGLAAGKAAPRIWLLHHLGRLGRRSDRGRHGIAWRRRVGVARHLADRRRGGPFALRCRQRVVPGSVGRWSARRARSTGASMGGRRAPALGRVGSRVVERAAAELGLVLVASNGLHFLIAWELFTLVRVFPDHARSAAARGAGGGLAVPGRLARAARSPCSRSSRLLAARTGSWDLGPMRERAELAPLFWLALFGFGVKAGVFPLHIWLPSAHANAPSHVSAILSGRDDQDGHLRPRALQRLAAGAGGGGLGGGGARRGQRGAGRGVRAGAARSQAPARLSQRREHRHHSHRARVRAGGGGARQRGVGALALAGGLLHVWNHGLFKALLFFGAGSVLHATGTREMSRLGGLWRAMPWTAGLFALGRGGDLRAAAAQRFRQRVAGVSRAVRRRDSSPGASAWGAIPAVDAAGHDRRAGAGVLRQGVRRGVPRRAAFAGGGTGARMRAVDARRDAGAGGRLRGHRPGAGRLLAGGARAVAAWRPAWADAAAPAPLAALGQVHLALAVVVPRSAGGLAVAAGAAAAGCGAT